MTINQLPKEERKLAILKLIEFGREQIDQIDLEIVGLIKERLTLAERVGRAKKSIGLPVVDLRRERDVLKKISKNGNNWVRSRLKEIFTTIIEACRNIQY